MTFEYDKHVPSRAEIVIGMAADVWRRWRDRCDFARFVENCPHEADRLARDLNVDKASLMTIVAQGREQPILLKRRLRALGIDPEQVRRTEPAVAQDMTRCCVLCGVKTRCAQDLARRPYSADWRSFCSNEQTLEALQAGQLQSSTAQ